MRIVGFYVRHSANETFEMTKILDWDNDDFFDVENQIEQKKKPIKTFVNDSFWENYNTANPFPVMTTGISLRTLSHREFPVMNTGSLQ